MPDLPMSAELISGTLVVVGASLAGLRAVEGARAAGFTGRTILVGEEPDPPYDRPPLSKAFMTGDVGDTTFNLAALTAGEFPAELRLGTKAIGLDVRRRQLLTGTGPIAYDRLVIATGAVPRVVADLPEIRGIHQLRSKADAASLRDAVRPDSRVVMLGGGFIGAELATAFRAIGASVTLLEVAEVPLVRALGDAMGREIASLHGAHGVDVHCRVGVTGVVGDETLHAVVLDDGSTIEADILVVGIGATPATGWLAGSGLQLDERDGAIVCDEYLATSVTGIWAAGDVTSWPSRTAKRRVRLENWTNATQQGSVAGRNAVCSPPVPYDTVSYAWSDWYGHRIQVVGRTDSADTVCYGSVAAGRMIALYRDEGRIVGAVTVNEPGRVMKLRGLIMAGADFGAATEIASRAGAR